MDETEITLRAIARVRLLVLLEQHQAGGVASLWQLQRAFRPASIAWQRAWSRDGHHQVRRPRPSTWPAGSRGPGGADVAAGETRSLPPRVGAVDAGGGVVG